MANVLFHPEAQAEYQASIAWYQARSPQAAVRFEAEVDLREMLHRASGHHRDVVPGRWVIETKHRRRAWEVIVEPEPTAQVLVVVTAYPNWGS